MLNCSTFKHRILSFFLIAALTAIASLTVVQACFDPTDKASIEVVLNKPGITYDLSRLKKLENVIEVEPGRLYIYRSHVHKDVVVILSLQKLILDNSAPKYLAVRVESPLAQVNKTVVNCGIDVIVTSLPISSEYVVRAAEDLGWYVSIEDLGNDSIRGYLEKVVGNITVRIYVARITGGLQLSIRANGKSDEVVREIDELLNKAFNLSEDTISSTGLGCFIVPAKTPLLKPAVGDEVLKEAFTYELRWLTKLGVIEGLTEGDILKLASAAKPGLAGWNERLVYWNGSWYPYAELVTRGLIEGGYLLKSAGGCSWDYPLDELPTDPPPEAEEVPSEVSDLGATLVGTAVATALAIAIAILFIAMIKQSGPPEV